MPREKVKEKVRPVHEIRLGRIKAAIWANETQNGAMFNVTLCRLYRDGGNGRTPAASAATTCRWSPKSPTGSTPGSSNRTRSRTAPTSRSRTVPRQRISEKVL